MSCIEYPTHLMPLRKHCIHRDFITDGFQSIDSVNFTASSQFAISNMSMNTCFSCSDERSHPNFIIISSIGLLCVMISKDQVFQNKDFRIFNTIHIPCLVRYTKADTILEDFHWFSKLPIFDHLSQRTKRIFVYS